MVGLDSETIKAVKELPLGAWLLVGIVSAGLAGLVIYHPELVPEPYPDTRKWIVLSALFIFPIATLLAVWNVLKVAGKAIRTPRWVKVARLVRKYHTLFTEQKALLDQVYKTGKDNFDVNEAYSEYRIFTQLETDGFIVVHPSFVFYDNMPVHCSLTPEASLALRKIHNMA